jgi:Astacin (Peptidase family M12A)
MATNKGKRRAASGAVPPGRDDGDKYLGEFRTGPAVFTGLIRGNTFAAKAVQYVVADGLALFEGDIVLGTEQEMREQTEQIRREQSGDIAMGVIITGAQFRWPGCRIPYTIDPALPNQARVTGAIAHWQSLTQFRFVLRTTEADYVTFRPGGGCSSQVGRRGGQQFVNLAPGCDQGRTSHEIGHVVGLWHEQSRQDRDLFVTVQWAKIQAGMEHNFNQHITDGDDVGTYDYGSLMHYPRDAFSIDGSDTLTPINPASASIGQRVGLSPGDVAAAAVLCPGTVTIKEAPRDVTIKELVKDLRADTRKELVFDTRKELPTDTIKEMPFDTVKEGTFDPGPNTLAENVVVPGRPVVINPLRGGLQLGGTPFALATPQVETQLANAQEALSSAAQLDAQLQSLSEALLQSEAQRQSLQEQYDETAGLLQRLLDAPNPNAAS